MARSCRSRALRPGEGTRTFSPRRPGSRADRHHRDRPQGPDQAVVPDLLLRAAAEMGSWRIVLLRRQPGLHRVRTVTPPGICRKTVCGVSICFDLSDLDTVQPRGGRVTAAGWNSCGPLRAKLSPIVAALFIGWSLS